MDEVENVKLERGSDTCIGPSPLRLLLLKFLVAILKRIPSSLDSSGKSRLRNEFEWVEESLQRNFEDWRRIERAWCLLKKEKDRSIDRNIFSSPRLICEISRHEMILQFDLSIQFLYLAFPPILEQIIIN